MFSNLHKTKGKSGFIKESYKIWCQNIYWTTLRYISKKNMLWGHDKKHKVIHYSQRYFTCTLLQAIMLDNVLVNTVLTSFIIYTIHASDTCGFCDTSLTLKAYTHQPLVHIFSLIFISKPNFILRHYFLLHC